MPIALVNGRVLTDDGPATDRVVLIDGARIVAVTHRDDARVRNTDSHDLQGQLLAPGFIDCQVNGGGGVLFNDDPSVATIRRIAAAHGRFGTTALLPTLISTDVSVMRAAVEAVREAIVGGDSRVLGIHFEGPLLSPARPGVHEVARLREPDEELIEVLCSLGVGRTLVTVAPDRVPLPIIERLLERGVILSAGHTAADYATARAAFEAGVRGVTHLFNAMSPLQSRDPGVVGAALEAGASWCGVIVDGHHVHPATLRVALAAKPRGRIMLVTDAMSPVGTDHSTFQLGDEIVRCDGGVCRTQAGVLAGSVLDMASSVRNSARWLGVSVEEAVRMGSSYPADFLGLEADRGRIAPGLRADFVVLDTDAKVREVWIGGARQPGS